MGQHKHNPTAIAAKNGELPPRAPKKSKRQVEREINAEIKRYMMEKVPGTAAIMAALGNSPVGFNL